MLHTLFHEDPRYEKYRKFELSTLYFLGDDIKSLGNEAYIKGDYYTALDYYEHVSKYFTLVFKDYHYSCVLVSDII